MGMSVVRRDKHERDGVQISGGSDSETAGCFN